MNIGELCCCSYSHETMVDQWLYTLYSSVCIIKCHNALLVEYLKSVKYLAHLFTWFQQDKCESSQTLFAKCLVLLAKLLLWVCLLSLNQDIHWREGTTFVMLAKLLLWVCLLSLNQDIHVHWREGTTFVMLARLLLWVCLLSLINLYIKGKVQHW